MVPCTSGFFDNSISSLMSIPFSCRASIACFGISFEATVSTFPGMVIVVSGFDSLFLNILIFRSVIIYSFLLLYEHNKLFYSFCITFNSVIKLQKSSQFYAFSIYITQHSECYPENFIINRALLAIKYSSAIHRNNLGLYSIILKISRSGIHTEI